MRFPRIQLSTLRSTQLGATLLELLTVVSIIGLVGYMSMPNYIETLSFKELNTAKTTLIQSLYRAKSIANAESTIATVTITSNDITLHTANDSADQVIALPGKIKVTETVTIKFNTIGEVLDSRGAKHTSNQVITLQTDSATNSVHKDITITTMGMILELPAAETDSGEAGVSSETTG